MVINITFFLKTKIILSKHSLDLDLVKKQIMQYWIAKFCLRVITYQGFSLGRAVRFVKGLWHDKPLDTSRKNAAFGVRGIINEWFVFHLTSI